MNDSSKKRLTRRKTPVLLLLCVLMLTVMLVCMQLFRTYTQSELYRESQNQLSEITTQIYEKLDVTFDQQWDLLGVMENQMTSRAPQNMEELRAILLKAQQELASSNNPVYFIAVDSAGTYFTPGGRRLQCQFMDKMPTAGRGSFFIREQEGEEVYMVFSMGLPTPLTMAVDGETTDITHLLLLKSMGSLQSLFRSGAFHQQNTTYIVESNGVQMYSDAASSEIAFLGRNIFPAMRTLRYPHVGSFDNILKTIQQTEDDYICTDVMVDGTEYFLCMKQLPGYDWLMLFFVPKQEVAASTRAMVDSMTLIVGLGGSALYFLVIGVVFFLMVSVQTRNRAAAEAEAAQQLSSANAELEKARAAAMDALKLAETASVSKTAFLANMSHDIRTPMNAIVGLATLMEHDLHNPDKLQAYITKLRASSEYLLGLINDVLDMSKIESGAATLRMDKLNMAEQIAIIESVIRPQAKQRGHHFIVHATQIHHENFLGDATRLRQVLVNILSNAVKYTPNGGEISLDVREVSRNGHSYVKYAFTVQDNGVGMTQEFQKKLFEVFTRAEDSTTNKVQGTGLGMAITKSIVDMMGGVINVESAPGKGSRFEVLLDFKLDEEAEQTPREIGGMCLMLLGYSYGRVGDILDVLEDTDMQVEVVEQISEAAERLRQQEVNVVLLSCEGKTDAEMLKTTRMLREAAGKPIFIFCMQAAQREDMMDTISHCELDGFIPMPFFLSNLENEIERLCVEDGRLSEQTGQSVLTGMRLLCAEDNELNAEILETLLEMKGASCTIYPDGQKLLAAFDHVRPSDYDIILMDVQMPNMNGYEATRAIRASDNPVGATIPIIAMTANAFADDIQRSMDAGMDMHLSKPIDITELEKTICVFKTSRTRGDGRAVFQRLQG